MIRARAVFKRFANDRFAISGLNLDVSRGDCLVVSGGADSGKSTLLRMLATLVRPTSGTIELDGRTIHPAAPEVRRRIAFADGWIDPASELTVREYAGAGVAERLGIMKNARLHTLGRDRVRVSCAAALGTKRDLILLDRAAEVLAADEPLLQWIRAARDHGSAVILEGNTALATALDARLLELSNGRAA